MIGKIVIAVKNKSRRVLSFAPSVSARRSRASFQNASKENKTEYDEREKIERDESVEKNDVALGNLEKRAPIIARLQNDERE
jgi:hypothetical protein